MQIQVQTVVIKVGTTLLTGPRGFDGKVVEDLVKEIAALKRERGLNVLIVSSGAIGCGMHTLNLTERPKVLPLKQATAAIGQARLMHFYQVLFATYGDGLHTAQVLLTSSDLDDRRRYLNIRNTIHTLFSLNSVVPVVNENDSVATDELRFGDNDTLSARVASKIDADMLIILSDIDGLYDKNPARFKSAKLIESVAHVNDSIEALAEDTGAATSVGGMKTKLHAARIACASGLTTVIANGHTPGIVRGVLDGTARCTRFGASAAAMSHRKRWIAFGRAARGTIDVDDGARGALLNKGKSLLAAGVTGVTGAFDIGASVRIRDAAGKDIACGLVNYSSGDLAKIKGCKSGEIHAILGHKDFDEVVHRDNLVLL